MKKSIDNLQYVGSFSTVHSGQRTEHISKGAPSYTKKQNELYNRLLVGLKAYTEEELYAMNSRKKARIKQQNFKAQKALNIWKQELTIGYTNSFFKEFFPQSEVTRILEECSDTSDEFINKLSFKELGVKKEDVIDKFIELHLLPKNFYDL